ncbi:type II toxin-antitoxin system death-on-curing family toxin [Modestobacter sp. I12A-02628]|uniref:Type II toxin-antitoxin system death-on-curing family toxin n=1 Tax=Goekera deserti TaxID=2497753 RepID=A0A7K3WFV0_9ACTN|nr:type II toxin-antitoxin system death-on-curing family toxin [Goekera deserti]MPQ96467.1 type II toxin-antitoxin system death-on-curing family toxin [Goekera deserti]NDI47218.1 type II toxin-antitoxin system death-on-curing family toxin [Goekera deserti]NEL55381.1 type II toxin-antitoxin system death-on-curing family toxin [Goekera deserti]
MIYLTVAELRLVADRATGMHVQLRDAGLLAAAAARPRATAFGADAYATLEAKAGALVHSLARNHALVDGNKRLALGGLIAFLGVNGRRLTLTNDEAYDLIIDIATGRLDDVGQIAARIREGSAELRQS